mgnify:CR=1 FL=1
MTMLTTPAQINTFRLCTLRRGIKLEQVGMKLSRGKSCLAIAKAELGFTRNAKAADVLAKLDSMIAEAQQEMAMA